MNVLLADVIDHYPVAYFLLYHTVVSLQVVDSLQILYLDLWRTADERQGLTPLFKPRWPASKASGANR